jgi:hypothetical protein
VNSIKSSLVTRLGERDRERKKRSRQLREGVLVTVLDDYTDRSGPLRVLWPSSRHLARKLRVFVDFLAANLVPAVEDEAAERETAG